MSITPAPWSVVLTVRRGSFHVPEAAKHEAANVDDSFDGHTVSSANARLIAAAPDLLAALQGLLDPATNEDFTWYADARNAARAAIAKATGEQQ